MKKVKSLAKINLGLEIVGRREDGYHELKTIFQTIDFFDVLEFKDTPSEKIILEGSDSSISWDESNLIFKAALILKEEAWIRRGIEIKVNKNIPPGKGLGGGSSNAAVVLATLNQIWEANLERKELMELGKKLGADVPYFLEGGLCLGLGRGDTVIPIADLEPYYCLLILPSFSISTAFVYQQVPSSLTSEGKESKINKFLSSRNIGLLDNDLEEIIFGLYPQLKNIKRHIQSQGCQLSLVSGSGSAVVGLFEERQKAWTAYERLKRYYRLYLIETVPRKRYSQYINFGV